MRVLPALVAKLAYCHSAWIIGSAAKPEANLVEVRDFDVAVPYTEWYRAAQLIPADAKPNTFGGWKCTSEGISVDLWPDDPHRWLTNPLVTHVWHPSSGVRWARHT